MKERAALSCWSFVSICKRLTFGGDTGQANLACYRPLMQKNPHYHTTIIGPGMKDERETGSIWLKFCFNLLEINIWWGYRSSKLSLLCMLLKRTPTTTITGPGLKDEGETGCIWPQALWRFLQPCLALHSHSGPRESRHLFCGHFPLLYFGDIFESDTS